jgi:hypothetical protein
MLKPEALAKATALRSLLGRYAEDVVEGAPVGYE